MLARAASRADTEVNLEIEVAKLLAKASMVDQAIAMTDTFVDYAQAEPETAAQYTVAETAANDVLTEFDAVPAETLGLEEVA